MRYSIEIIQDPSGIPHTHFATWTKDEKLVERVTAYIKMLMDKEHAKNIKRIDKICSACESVYKTDDGCTLKDCPKLI